jgi:hypothetical protein
VQGRGRESEREEIVKVREGERRREKREGGVESAKEGLAERR